jgi:hypothetical protein
VLLPVRMMKNANVSEQSGVLDQVYFPVTVDCYVHFEDVEIALILYATDDQTVVLQPQGRNFDDDLATGKIRVVAKIKRKFALITDYGKKYKDEDKQEFVRVQIKLSLKYEGLAMRLLAEVPDGGQFHLIDDWSLPGEHDDESSWPLQEMAIIVEDGDVDVWEEGIHLPLAPDASG